MSCFVLACCPKCSDCSKTCTKLEPEPKSAQDTNFGTIEKGPSGQSNLPREMQLALKLMW